MSSLSQNINQAINDFDSIKRAIEDKGVTVGNVPTSEYADKISQIQTGQEVMFSSDGRCYVPNIIIPDNVTSIGNYAFNNCSDIVSVAIGNNVTSIANNAFQRCTNLTSVIISNSVTSIGGYAFADCTSLTSVTIPNSVTSIGNNAFADCTSLTSVTIPNSVTSIGNNAFQGSFNITDIQLGQGFNASLTLSNWWWTIQLTADVMVAMFEALADLTGQTAKTLALGAKNLAKLTDAQKQIATNKNWNLA